MRKIWTIADLEDTNPDKIVTALRNQSFDTMIERWSLELAKRGIYHENKLEWNRPRLKKVFHPSSIDSDCDFKLFLDLWGTESKAKRSPSLQMVFDTGTAIHGQLDYLFETHAREYGYEFTPEVGFKPSYIEDSTRVESDSEPKYWVMNTIIDKLKVAGHADGVMVRVFEIKGKLFSIRIVFEFKTISSSGFRKLGSKPQLPHRKQSHAYMRCLDIPFAVVFYINKDNSNSAALPMSFDKELWNPIEERLLSVKKLTKEYQEPDKKEGGSCRMCGYFDACNPRVPKRSNGRYGAPRI